MAREQLHLPPAFEDLMRRYEQEIMRFLLRAARDREDAADLFQETWLRAYRAYPRLAPGADARPWLYAIAANLGRNRARDRARRDRVIVPQTHDRAAPPRAKSGRTPHENDGYAAIHLRQLISALPRKQREALYLRYFAGLDFAAIGAAMRCTAQAARANVSQAARKLKAGRWEQ
jgi:RNA polymerase sigma-70 factor (ECF subfamily)